MNDKEKFKEILLQTFQAFDQFCKKNDLTYFGGYGTVLGAIRHKGLIPWDDDIDVVMPRKDYNKFLSLKDKVEGDYEIVNRDNEGYYLNFAKFQNTKTTILPSPELPFVLGVFVDVFAIDENDGHIDKIRDKLEEYEQQLLIYLKSVRNHSFSYLKRCLINHNYKVAFKTISNICYYQFLKNKSLKKIQKLEQEFQQIRGSYYCRYAPIVKECLIFPKEWFGEGIRVPYENTTMIIPKDFDPYLRTIYGDYMQLPPVEKRVTRHFAVYMNLEKRLSYDEILKEIE